MPYVERAGAPTVYYEIDDHTDPWKNAPYLLLYHGLGRNTRFWYNWVPYLSRHYRVLRMDMRGFGRSRQRFDPAQGFRFADLVDEVVAVIDAVGAQSVHFCGEHFGGTLGFQLAAEHPQRVRTLSLMSAQVYLQANIQKDFAMGEASWVDALRKHGIRKWTAQTNASKRFPPQTDPGFLDWYCDELAKTDLETLISFSQLCSAYNLTEYLPRIGAPVLAFYPRTRPDQVALMRKHVKRVDIVTLDTDYSMFYCLRPRQCAQAVLHFAAAHDGVPCTE